jgi:uncharacterized paraquat-inducible protein A
MNAAEHASEITITCPHCDVAISVPEGLRIQPGVCPRFAARLAEVYGPPLGGES